MTLEFETSLGCAAIGVDEAGRGPLAGPVFAAAVHVPLERARVLLEGEWSEVDDSKRLSAAKRERLALAIKSESVWCVASASAAEIDELNILRATHLAMRRAVEGVLPRISGEAAALVDGLPVKGLPCRSVNVVKGDSKSLLIAAASILAKTARDADCLRLEAAYPEYGFARHKGYPVKAHIEALRRLGPCPEHRMSFAPVKACRAAMGQ